MAPTGLRKDRRDRALWRFYRLGGLPFWLDTRFVRLGLVVAGRGVPHIMSGRALEVLGLGVGGTCLTSLV